MLTKSGNCLIICQVFLGFSVKSCLLSSLESSGARFITIIMNGSVRRGPLAEWGQISESRDMPYLPPYFPDSVNTGRRPRENYTAGELCATEITHTYAQKRYRFDQEDHASAIYCRSNHDWYCILCIRLIKLFVCFQKFSAFFPLPNWFE